MRIVSLISSGTEILFALGLGSQVLAVSHECDYPPAAARLPQATRSRIDSSRVSGDIDDQVRACLAGEQPLYDVDAELLCRLAPDLIVTQAQCDVCAVRLADVVDLVQSRPELSRTAVLPLNPQSLGEVLDDVMRVGFAAGVEADAKQLREVLRRRVDAVSQTTAQLAESDRPRVVCVEWVQPLMAAGNWTPELIELAGGRSGLATAGRHSDYVTWEQIRAYAPDILVVAPCGFNLGRSQAEAKRLFELPGFADLAAVRSGRAFVVDGNSHLNRSGPRLVLSLELLAALFHPQLFAPLVGELAEGHAWSSLTPLHA